MLVTSRFAIISDFIFINKYELNVLQQGVRTPQTSRTRRALNNILNPI